MSVLPPTLKKLAATCFNMRSLHCTCTLQFPNNKTSLHLVLESAIVLQSIITKVSLLRRVLQLLQLMEGVLIVHPCVTSQLLLPSLPRVHSTSSTFASFCSSVPSFPFTTSSSILYFLHHHAWHREGKELSLIFKGIGIAIYFVYEHTCMAC